MLVARLRALARRSSASRPPVLTAGDLVLDPLSRACRRGEVAIELSRREGALLGALLRREGRPVPKDDLLREVWGDDFGGDTNVVEVYVGYLRRKIDGPFGRRSLETVRGVGYRVRSDA